MNKSILIFTDNYPYGKSEPFLQIELENICLSFAKVAIFPLDFGREDDKREVPEKVEIIAPAFKNIRNKKHLLVKGIFNNSLLLPLLKEGIISEVWKSWTKLRIWIIHFLMIRGLLSEIEDKNHIQLFNQFDILYFYWGLHWSQILPFLPEDMNNRIVVRFHGSDLYEYTNNFYIPWRHEQLSRITKAIAISETGKQYIENQYPILKDKILVSRIGTKDFGLNPCMKRETPLIVSCSNLVPVKRVRLIVETLGYLKIPVNWIHFGDGPEMDKIKKQVEQLPVNVKGILMGAIGHDELMNYFRTTSIDLLLNVSGSEGVPVSVMEAMSFGIPVIATNVGGTSEIVSEKTGLLIDPEFSPEYLAGKIEELIRRNDLNNLRIAAREEWEKRLMAQKVYPAFFVQLLSI